MGDERREHLPLFTEFTGGDAVTSIGYTCPQGYTAKVIYFGGYHNQGANLNAQFVLSDGTLTRNITPDSSLATATILAMYPLLNQPDTIILHQGWAINFAATVTAGHALSYRLLVEVRKGEAS
jgi:hypothetical protein